jgi:hypothetical protein
MYTYKSALFLFHLLASESRLPIHDNQDVVKEKKKVIPQFIINIPKDHCDKEVSHKPTLVPIWKNKKRELAIHLFPSYTVSRSLPERLSTLTITDLQTQISVIKPSSTTFLYHISEVPTLDPINPIYFPTLT